jgi:hypothetical protein
MANGMLVHPSIRLDLTTMNHQLRVFWYHLVRLTSDDPSTIFGIAAVSVLAIGVLCLRGNIIKR